MRIYRSANNFTSKIDVEPAPDSLRNLVDKCLDAAMNRPDPKAQPPAEAWFDIESDNYRLSIGMQSIEANYVYLCKGAPDEPQKKASKGFFGFLKAFAKANSGQDLTASLSKDQLVSFLVIILTDDLEKITSFLQPYSVM
jgi:hypothetical protein